MAAVPKSYKKNIAEGNGILIFAIILALLVRLAYYFSFDFTGLKENTNGYFWTYLSPLFNKQLVSAICSTILTAGLATISAHINTTHVLIRRKTSLVPAIVILLFSCHPSFIYVSAEYISTLLFLLIIAMLFTSYNNGQKQISAFKSSFFLALGSLFSPLLLIYLPVLWVCLAMMRCMNFKSFIATLLGFFILYFPAFSFYLFTDNVEAFINPFTSITIQQLSEPMAIDLNIINWVILGFSLILLGIIITDNYINRHKDKIRTRAYLRLLSFIVIFSIIVFLFFNINPTLNIFIGLSAGTFLLAHFFALAERRGTTILFYTCILFYIFICISSFLSL